MDMIFTIGIFTALFFFFLLLNKKNKSLPDSILSIWMLMIGIHLSSTYVYSLGYWEIYPHLIGITAPFPLLYGPFLFLYVSYSLKSEAHFYKSSYIHFLPAVLSYLYMSSFYFFYSAEEKTMVDKGLIDDFGLFSNILILSMIISAIGYTIYSYRLLNKHKRLIENNFSNTENINLNWLKGFILGMALIFITGILVLLSQEVFEFTFLFNPEFIFYSTIVFAVLSLGYFGIRHENIFTDNLLIVDVDKISGSYKSSSLKEDVATEKHTALMKFMLEKKPYLNPNLTLNALAESIDVPLHHLSQIINQFEGKNFNDFVNNYRVEEFIRRASTDTHFSFLALALDSGFSSKSTFNAVFRKHKGLTPSQFISSHQKKDT